MRRMPKPKTKNAASMEKARRAKYSKILADPAPRRTWSSQMPPYCYTELCPDAGYRPGCAQEVMPCGRNAAPAYAGHA